MNLGFLGGQMKNLGFPGLGSGGVGNQPSNLFRPNQLPNLAAWYDAADSSTITIATGVSQWNDKSGNGRNLSQGTGANQPIQSAGGILFNGSSQFLQSGAVTLTQPTTVYMVGNQTTWVASRVFWDLAATTVTLSQTAASSSPNISANAGSASANLTTWPVATNGIITTIFNGATSSLRYNRTAPLTGNYGATNGTKITIGATATPTLWSTLRIFEFVLYSAAHDDATQQKIILALGRKWSISV